MNLVCTSSPPQDILSIYCAAMSIMSHKKTVWDHNKGGSSLCLAKPDIERSKRDPAKVNQCSAPSPAPAGVCFIAQRERSNLR